MHENEIYEPACCGSTTIVNIDLTPLAACLLVIAALFVIFWARPSYPAPNDEP